MEIHISIKGGGGKVIVLPLLILFFIVLVRTAWVNDDAYITFRTVHNFVNGYGLRWNPSERVQTYTNPLWMFIMSDLYFFTREIFYTSIIFSILLSITTLLILVHGISKTSVSAFLAVTILLFSKAFIDYSTSGLENPLTHFLLAFFLLIYLTENPSKTIFSLSFIAALLALNRLEPYNSRQQTLQAFYPNKT